LPKQPQRRGPLTKERVLQVAIKLADQRGVAALTMRNLAERLGVEAMSLYHHFAGKDAILDGLVDAVFAEIEVPSGVDWQTAMRRRAHAARAALLRHRWALGFMESRKHLGPNMLGHHDAVLGCLRRSGFSVEQAAHAFSLLDSYTYGFLLQELNLAFDNTQDLQAKADEVLEHEFASLYPHFHELVVTHALQPGHTYAKEFAFGLELVLTCLEKLREQA